ncbi:MAG: hypothetical protein WCC92_19265 [Candidatus Korobacteraceae bacterium]
MNPRDMDPYWLDERDWLCTLEFLSTEDSGTRAWDAEDIGYLLGYAWLTDTRTLALVGDPDAEVYEILFSFSSPAGKRRFLDLVRANEDMGDSYVEEEFIVPVASEIQDARPLAMVLPNDVVQQATFIAAMLVAGIEHSGTIS